VLRASWRASRERAAKAIGVEATALPPVLMEDEDAGE
jgi:hypothetical protein